MRSVWLTSTASELLNVKSTSVWNASGGNSFMRKNKDG